MARAIDTETAECFACGGPVEVKTGLGTDFILKRTFSCAECGCEATWVPERVMDARALSGRFEKD